MKPQLKKLEEEIDQLCWLAEIVHLEAQKVDRTDMSIDDWNKIEEALNGALIEASPEFQMSNERQQEPDIVRTLDSEGFDSRVDFPCYCAELLMQAITVRKLINKLSPREFEPEDTAEFEPLFEAVKRHVQETLYSLFVVGELTDFEVGTLMIRKPERTSDDWVGVRLAVHTKSRTPIPAHTTGGLPHALQVSGKRTVASARDHPNRTPD